MKSLTKCLVAHGQQVGNNERLHVPTLQLSLFFRGLSLRDYCSSFMVQHSTPTHPLFDTSTVFHLERSKCGCQVRNFVQLWESVMTHMRTLGGVRPGGLYHHDACSYQCSRPRHTEVRGLSVHGYCCNTSAVGCVHVCVCSI